MESSKKIISTVKAPAAIGPYSQAVIAGNLLFTSGQIALIPETGVLVQGDVSDETRQVMANLSAILTTANLSFDNVVKTTIFLKDMNDFATVNEIYASYFGKDFPARETVEVARLPKDVRVEISMIALLD
jgi:2-iminobutanoate/2-iminopropanoate deaminase